MAARLIAEEGALQGQEFSLSHEGETIIGRDPELAQIVLEDPSVSRQHVKCLINSEGIVLENLSTTNPTLVNDAEFEGMTTLVNGDSVKIGDLYFRFYSEEAEPVAEVPEEAQEEPVREEVSENVERDTLFEESPEEAEKGLLAEIDLDLTDDAPWLLKVVSGPNSGAQFSMHPGMSYVVGTDPSSCDIVFHDVSVSRQHARLTIASDGKLSVEDLGSSNGTMVESKKIEQRTSFNSNALISVGTTSFVIYDREGERKTIISPLLPSIVKVLQEQKTSGEEKEEEKPVPTAAEPLQLPPPPPKKPKRLLALIIGGLILFSLLTMLLFRTEEIEKPTYDTTAMLEEQIRPFPKVRQSFNPTTGRLLLVGHVLNSVDRDELLHDLKSLPFVKTIDNYIVVDEFIWQEQNQILAKNPAWKGITIHSPTPGKYVISGYIQTRAEADALSDYLGQNFPYLDLLEQKIVVEEDIINRITVMLLDAGIRTVRVAVSNNEVVLTGDIPFGETPTFNDLIAKFRQIPGVRTIKSFVTEAPPEA
ncbi:MAG: type III secretion system inner membrane ring subunit SctD, partial [Chlamydiia bacterium]|nr:type III secretion system inner membrane ring subunit SctD [Chlamydiia bacterium]